MVVADEQRVEYLIDFFERLPVIMRTGDPEEQIDAEHEVVPALATSRSIDEAALSAKARERYEYLKTLFAAVNEILLFSTNLNSLSATDFAQVALRSQPVAPCFDLMFYAVTM